MAWAVIVWREAIPPAGEPLRPRSTPADVSRTERGGFEPPKGFDTLNGLANRHAPSPNYLTRKGVNDLSTIAFPHPCPTIANRQASLPPDLAAVVNAWPTLPEALKAGIVAMVQASAPPPSGGDRPTKRTRGGGGR